MITAKDINHVNCYSKKMALMRQPLLNYTKSKIFNLDNAEDIVHNTLLILSQKRNDFDPNKNFYSWAFKICNFQIKRFLTESKRNLEDTGLNLDALSSKVSVSPRKLIKDKEKNEIRNNLILKLKDQLSPQQKIVFTNIIGGMPRKKLNKLMGLKEKHFNLAYLRTIRGCQRILEQNNNFELANT